MEKNENDEIEKMDDIESNYSLYNITNFIILVNNNQNNFNSSPETKRKSKRESKNILNIDFDNPSPKKTRIQTPHSKQSLLELGLTENDLFKIDIKEYLLMNPELKTEPKEMQEK